MNEIPKYQFDHQVKLFSLSDVHYANNAFDPKLFSKTIIEIRDNPNAYWLSVGDILELALKDSLSFDYNELNPENEFYQVVDALRPIADKCLGIVSSNHHNRMKKASGFSIDRFLANELKVPFLGDIGLINIVCGRLSYYVCFHHGCGGGRMKGGKINNLNRLASIYHNCDLYIEGHTHTYMSFQDLSLVVDRKRGKLTEIESTFVTGGHCLDYGKSYAVRLKYTPAPKGFAYCDLAHNNSGIEHNKNISVGLFQ